MTLDNFVSSNVLSADALQPTTIATTWATPLMTGGRSTATSLLFVDAGVSDYRSLAAAAQPGTEVHLLSSTQDAIGQITNTLLGRSGISSISILSHGADGELDFAGGALSLGNLSSHLGELQSWQQALAAGADILLYGCDVAADVVGQSFVNQIGAATGADVAASSNLTGSAALGGDWVLEYQTGTIEAAVLAVANYASVLATFHVTNTNDAGAGSLRAAISQADAAPGADTIDFTGSIFKDAAPDQITLTTGALSINSDITIKGTGANKLSISGNNASRVFGIGSGSKVTISGIYITQGKENANPGGGIYNGGTLILNNSTITGNTAVFGGGIENLSVGTVTLNNSTVSGNTANYGGGINSSGTLTLNNSTVSGNTGNVFGGGIISNGIVTLKSSIVSGNTASYGGGIYNAYGGVLTLNNSTVSGNTATSFGGGIENNNGGTLILNNSTVSGNTATIYGGGIYNNGTSTVNNSTLTGNKAISGGGIFNSRTLALKNSILSGNTATTSGGGIYNDDFGGATLDISSTNIKGNTAPLGANIYSV